MKASRKATSIRKTSRKPSKPASPKVRALRAVQGKYMGTLRQLTVAQRAKVKKAAAKYLDIQASVTGFLIPREAGNEATSENRGEARQ